jgi:hypothetical protein
VKKPVANFSNLRTDALFTCLHRDSFMTLELFQGGALNPASRRMI